MSPRIAISRILVVDDQADGREMLVELLHNLGHEAEAVSSGEEALDLLARGNGHDVMLVDQNLYGGMDGFEVLRKARSMQPELPVVLFTGHGDVEAGMDALRMGAYRYIFKPVQLEELNLIIHALQEMKGLRREKEWLKSLLELTNAMLRERDLDQILRAIADAVRLLLDFRLVLVGLVEGDSVRYTATSGLNSDEAARLNSVAYTKLDFFDPMQERFRIGNSYFIPYKEYDWMAKLPTMSPLRDLGQRPAGEWQSGDRLRVPIHSPGEEIVGVISVSDPRDRRLPTVETVQALELLAAQAALSIENARLFEEEKRRRRIADTLIEVPKALNATLDLERVLERILFELQRVVAYDTTSVQLYNEERNGLEVIACQGFDDPDAVRAITFALDATRHPNVDVWQRRQPRIVPNVQTMYPAFAEGRFHAHHIQSWMGVPLLYKDEAIGVISIDSMLPNLYQPEHAQLAMSFANQAAVAIANARLFRETQRRADELKTLLEVGQTLASKATSDPGEVLQTIVDGAASVTGADCVVVYPYRSDTSTYDIDLIKTHGVRKPLIPRESPRREGGLGASIIQSGQLLVFDVEKDSGLQKAKFIQREGIKTFAAGSLVAGEDPVGLLFVSYRQAHVFSQDELQTIHILANQAAVAIYNSRLYQTIHLDLKQHIDELIDRDKLSRAIIEIKSSLDLDALLNRVLEKALLLTGAPFGSISLLDDTQRSYQVRAMLGDWRELGDTWFDVPSSAMNFAVERKRPYRTGGMTSVNWDDEFLPKIVGPKAVLMVPLLESNRVIGCVTVASSDVEMFDEADEIALDKLAPEVVLAVQNTRRYDEMRQRVSSLDTMLQIGQLVTQSLKLEEVLGHVVNQGRQLSPALDMITLYYRDEATNTIRLGGQAGVLHQELLPAEEAEDSLVARVMREDSPVYALDVAQMPNVHTAFVKAEGVRSLYATSLSASGQVVGALFVYYRRLHYLSNPEAALLGIFASYAAIAINNARQFEMVEKQSKRLLALRDAGQSMAASLLSADDTIRTILRHAQEVTGAWVSTYQRLIGEELEFVLTSPPDRLVSLQVQPGKMHFNQGVTGRAARTGKPQLVFDTSTDPDFLPPQNVRPLSELAVPLMDGDTCLGVLNLEHIKVGGFSEEDLKFVLALADDAVVAIRNAERYQELKQMRDRMVTAEAVAGMGLLGSELGHEINQKTFSFSAYLQGLEIVAQQLEDQPGNISRHLRDSIAGIGSVLESIRRVGGKASLPGRVDEPVLFDEEVSRLAQMWCKPGAQVQTPIELVLDLRCPGVWGHIESQWLTIALEKVLRNAITAMNGNGILTVSTRQAGDILRLRVHDNGEGLPDYARPDFLRRPIRRPKELDDGEHKGTGRGVLIARFVLLVHGGNLELDFSNKEQGTQVSINLPIYDSPAAHRALEEYAN